MSLDLQSLSTDTLLYMLMHSGAFVAIMGTVFFLIGLIFGHATWGRYKAHSRLLGREIDQQRQEIATLKRKLGEQSVKPGTSPIATETIELDSASSAPATHDMPPPAPVVMAEAPLPPPSPALPAEPVNDTVAPADDPSTSTLSTKGKAAKSKTTVKARPAESKIVIEPLPTPDESGVPASDASSGSPLAAIIAPHPSSGISKPAAELPASDVGALDVFPALPEGPPAEVKPERDPKLGLIYKTPPVKADDLTAMKGIAKVLEQRLHEFGIYTYEQIASWTEDQIKEFSSRLAFKDRIHREKWVEQARKLLDEQKNQAA